MGNEKMTKLSCLEIALIQDVYWFLHLIFTLLLTPSTCFHLSHDYRLAAPLWICSTEVFIDTVIWRVLPAVDGSQVLRCSIRYLGSVRKVNTSFMLSSPFAVALLPALTQDFLKKSDMMNHQPGKGQLLYEEPRAK